MKQNMKMQKQLLWFVIIAFVWSLQPAFSQTIVPANMRGDRKYRKQGLHNGNLVETLFWNFGEVAWWGKQPSGVWPKGSGHSYMDGITPIVAGEVKDATGKTIHIIEAGYRENMDVSPRGVERGFQPRPGYANPNQDNIAMSDNPISWPASWPNRNASWNGKWNGYFGQQTNADQESYFVMDDNSDDGQNYYPDSTDHSRRGLGMRVEVRGFQWSNILAQDILFWHYEITNESTTDYTKVVFGMYVDSGVGGQYDSNDDNALYDKSFNLTYTWDTNGLGEGGWSPTGYAGYAFLESPGNPYNGFDDDDDTVDPNAPRLKAINFQPRTLNAGDNFVVIEPITYKRTVKVMPNQDTTVYSLGARFILHPGMTLQELPGNNLDDNLDGLIDENEKIHTGFAYHNYLTGSGADNSLVDERRDNDAGQIVKSWVPDYTQQPDAKGHYPGILKDHRSGDEDGDWNVNVDDVGADGIPGTSDTGEGDKKPTPGEPHFNQTDKDESDQIGLTAFDVFFIGTGVVFRDDEVIWQRIANSHFGTGQNNGNVAFLYGSGPFPLPPGTKERFSLALVFGQQLDDLIRHRITVQQIYNNNYNFARPPDKPHVTLVPGDKKITVYWDDVSEKSYDPIMNPPYDFEGYKIYKSTDIGFADAYTITSGYGDKTAFQPVAQFDIRDGIGGFFALPFQGLQFYLGDDKGLRHSWVDTNVVNGQTYYYAVISYDRGDAAAGIYPSECTKVISRNVYGTISYDLNTGSATPRSKPAGFYDARLEGGEMNHASGPATGLVNLNFTDPLKVKNNKKYRVVFDDTTRVDTVMYSLLDVTNSNTGSPLFTHSMYINNEDFNPMFDGMKLSVRNDTVDWDPQGTSWTKGKANLLFRVTIDENIKNANFQHRIPGYPSSYEIRIGLSDTSYLFFNPRYRTNFQVWDVTENKKMRYFLREPAGRIDSVLNAGDIIELYYANTTTKFWSIELVAPPDTPAINPDSGSAGFVKINKPFRSGDVYEFTTLGPEIDLALAKQELRKIAVVPNPYVAAASWEPQRLTQSGRGDRRIEFIHLPPRATIRIYTISGELVQTLEHDGVVTDGTEPWNLRNKDNMDIAPGLYLFHVDAPNIGVISGKFAIVK
jgi:hypothetical protein